MSSIIESWSSFFAGMLFMAVIGGVLTTILVRKIVEEDDVPRSTFME